MNIYSRPFYLMFLFMSAFSYAVESYAEQSQARLSITSEVTTGSVITVQWQGPNNPGDQIALHESGSSDWMSSQFTARGNPVGIGMADEPGLYDLSYHTKTGVLASLQIDCSGEVINGKTTCRVLDRVDVQK